MNFANSATPNDVRLRLRFAQAQWAALLREGPAHKRADLVQTLGRISRQIDELELALRRMEAPAKPS